MGKGCASRMAVARPPSEPATRAYTRPPMTTAGKLWLGFGLLLALLVRTGVFVAHRLALIERALVTIMAVQEPATAATYEMAVNVITTRSAVLHYSDTGEPEERTRVDGLMTEFGRHKQRFDQVARSATSRELGR